MSLRRPAARRRPRLAALLALSLVLAAACGPGLPAQRPAAPQAPSPAAASPTPVPGPDQVAAAFFRAWEQRQYEQMYELLSQGAKASITREGFVRRYTNIHQGIGVTRISVQAQPAVEELPAPPPTPSGAARGSASPSPAPTPAPAARVDFQVTRGVPIFGELVEANRLPLVREAEGWKVAWHAGLIFKDLTATSSVSLETNPPRRGRILDRHGNPLAEDGPAFVSVGVVPGQVKDEAALLKALSEALKLDQATIKRRYQGGQPDWFMPIAERPGTDRAELEQALGSVPGVLLRDRIARIYPLGDAAAHVVGYVTHPSGEELRRLAETGLEEDDWVGRAGVEAWAETHLAGRKGGTLLIRDNASGRVLRAIADRPVVHGSDVQLALDAEIQQRAAEVLGDRTGSVVVLDPRDGSVLALASHPTFDPNKFVQGLTEAEWQELNGPARPLLLRATEAAYPTGSTFKAITMAAGMEKGGVRTSDTFNCGLEWRGLPGSVLRNWTSQGTLDLVEALAQSCNPAFYTIGLKLDELDASILPSFARAFGLGQPTGVLGVSEVPGVVPDPQWKQRQLGQPWTRGDAVNLAIGQGYLLVTPLQLANAYAALANGGTLRSPLLVKAIRRPDGAEVQTFAPQEKGRLPISEATRSAILEGMRRVTSTQRGTAVSAFRGSRLEVAAKTGSAENETPNAHAWFVGFATPREPTVLALVMVEGGEQGGLVAAPLGRRVLELAYEKHR